MDESGGHRDIYCTSCGEQLEPSDHFCPMCGSRNDRSDSPPPSVSRQSSADHGSRHSTPDSGDRKENDGFDQREDSGWDNRNTEEWDDRSADGWDLQSRGEPAPGHQPPGERVAESGPGRPGYLRGKESPLKTLLVATGVGILGILVPFVVLIPLGGLLVGLVPIPGMVLFLLLTIAQFSLFVVVGFWYLRYRGFSWDDIRAYLGVEMPSLRDIGLILLTWFVMLIAAVLVATVVIEFVEYLGYGDTEPADNPVGGIIEENPEIVVGAVLFMFLVVGPAEEILFRGVVQNRLRERLSKIPAILFASALFAAVHVVALVGQDPVAIAQTLTILFVPSLGFGFIYEYTENIVVPSLLHGFHNSVIVVITALSAIYDLEEAMILPELLTLLIG